MHTADNVSPLGREAAVQTDEAAAVSLDLADVWHDLTRGHVQIRDSFHSATRFYLILTRTIAARAPATRDITVLETWLDRGSQKVAALEFSRSNSTISGITKRFLHGMGLDCSAFRIPPILIMAAAAKRFNSAAAMGRRSTMTFDGETVEVVSVARPDNALGRKLTAAETAVVRLLIEGKTYAEIAVSRNASPRTIANQLASASHRLGVSGRVDLIAYLLSQGGGARRTEGRKGIDQRAADGRAA